MSVPFSFVGNLNLPGDRSLPQQPIPFNISGQYDSKAEYDLSFSGVGTKTVPFGTAAMATGIFLRFPASATSTPILLTLNGSVTPIELSPGGQLALYSPTPTLGITSLSFIHTATGSVVVWILG